MSRHRYETLAVATSAELEAALRGGLAPDPQALAGSEFRGWNTPFFAPFLGIQKFKKGFFVDEPAGGRVRGYNRDVRQEGGLSGPWLEKGTGGAKAYGFYEVEVQSAGCYPGSVLLNYDCPRNPRANPIRLLRDYVVQVDPGNPDLLLGKAYLGLPPRGVFVSWFVLERLGPGRPPL
jgi:hypothetical protein